MDFHDVHVRILPLEAVRPHEIADPAREERIERRLREEALLRDPIIVGVVPDVEGFVLLDGTNRHRALARLGYPYVMAQVLDYADVHAVTLRTWCHAARVATETLVAAAETLSGIEVQPLPPLGAPDALREGTTLAVLLDRTRRFVLTRSGLQPSRADQLRRLVDLYESRMTREDCDPENVEEHAKRLNESTGDPVTVVAFPAFTRAQVVGMSLLGTPIPAGITRHVISNGRALRVNLPLRVLGLESLEAAAAALSGHMATLQPRLYREPTILFDS